MASTDGESQAHVNSCIDTQINLATLPYDHLPIPVVIDISGGSPESSISEGGGNLTQHRCPPHDSDSEESDWDGDDDVIATLSDGGRDGGGDDGVDATDDGDSEAQQQSRRQWESYNMLSSSSAWGEYAPDEEGRDHAREEGDTGQLKVLSSEPSREMFVSEWIASDQRCESGWQRSVWKCMLRHSSR